MIHTIKKIASKPLWYLRKFFGYSIFYSNTWEDIIVNYILNNKKDGFYVDVWMNEPVRWNNTYLFYKMWWKGICIEPIPSLSKKCKRYRPRDTNLNIWIWNDEWILDFYELSSSRLSTFSKEMMEMRLSEWYTLKWVTKLPIKKLSTVFEENKVKEVDILSIDTEGYELEVLQSNNRDEIKPIIVVLENQGHDQESQNTIMAYLKKQWYTMIANTYVNWIYKLDDEI